MIQTRDCPVEFNVIGNIDWDGFINYFMKEIHIIEIKPNIKDNGGILTCLHILI